MHKSLPRYIVTSLFSVCATATLAHAPAPAGPANCRTGAALQSVEAAADGKVTFRLCAPDATDVRVNSSDMAGAIPFDRGGPAGLALTKDATGLWSGTAIIRTQTPFQLLHPGYAFGSIQHEGDLDFKPGDPTLAVIRAASAKVPTVVTVMLDRPAILTNVKPLVAALFGDFGISDDALLDVIAGKAQPEGKLPFELPSSMQAVRQQKSDLPFDSLNPLYPFGFGLRYNP